MTGAAGVPGTTADELARLDEVCFPSSERWSAAAWEDELRAADRLIGLRHLDARLVAAATVQVVAGVADLHRILVHPEYRGRGIARDLLGEMLARTADRADRILLEVRPDNTAAVTLYRSIGFQVIASRASYYGPGIDALVMDLSLSPAAGSGLSGASDGHPDAGVSGGVCHAGDEPGRNWDEHP